MDRFSKYNPKATLLFFVAVIIATLTLFHPVYTATSFIAAFCYKLVLDGRSAWLYLLKFPLWLIALASIFNMLFVHKGVTVLFTAFDTIFTLEAFLYGLLQGIMFSSVVIWLSCYNIVVTADSFVSVFGRISPNTALVFVMTLTFMPRLKRNLSEISDARLQLSKGKSRIKIATENLSALMTLTLEESIETANSMKSRGFNSNRSVYSKYRFGLRDGVIIITEIIALSLCIIVKLLGKAVFIYEPVIMMGEMSIIGITAFSILVFLPVFVNALENIKWRLLRQRI